MKAFRFSRNFLPKGTFSLIHVKHNAKRGLFRQAIYLAIVLVVIVAPFLLFGELAIGVLESWQTSPPHPAWLATVVIALLASDILLPIPSSPLSTLAGAELGVVWGTLASWLGMNFGALGGYGLARVVGWPLARRYSSRRDLARARWLVRRYGATVLVVFRAAPILAEATVLLAGAMRMDWRRFFPPVFAANLGVAVVYSALGQYAKILNLLPLAIVLSIVIPLGFALIFRRYLGGRRA